MKDDWKIKDFTKWGVEDEFSFNDAAHLYYGIDPESSEGIPGEMSIKVSEMLNILSEAAGKGTLYEPEFRSGAKLRRSTHKTSVLPGNISYLVTPDDLAHQGIAYRDDLRYFFAERLGEKPAFLFPGEREGKSSETENTHEEDFELKEADYKIWDARTEVPFNEAACLLLDLIPHKCLISRYDLTHKEELSYHKDLPSDLRARIETVRGLLKEARKNDELEQTTPTGPHSWMAMPFTPKVSKASLKAYAERNGFKPKALFPELGRERGKQQKKPVFPCPEARWEDITLTLIADDTVRVKTPNGEGKFNYHKLELTDKRKGDQPTVLWPLLRLFIKERGTISSQTPNYNPKLPDTTKRLNRHLKELFGIKESIYTGHYKKENGYRLKFVVSDQTFNSHQKISE